jgi:predicted acylesterase/phospholipase RssA
VLNGFFHAVQLAAQRHPDLYKPAARSALSDLENLIAHVEPKKIAHFNLNPLQFLKGWANLGPLEEFLTERLATYTGSQHPEQITFDDIALPMTITAARLDGFTDFLGMTSPDRRWHIGGREWSVLRAPVIRAVLAGWSMNTYITPIRLGDQSYTDGGSTFYDAALFVACMDPELTNLLNIHLDEPEGHSYNLPPRPNLLKTMFEIHNYAFPEERRRMRLLTDLLYQHYQLRQQYAARLSQLPSSLAQQHSLPPDFRRTWEPEHALSTPLHSY